MPHTNDLVLVPGGDWDDRILVCQNGKLVQTFLVVTRRYVVVVDTLINTATAEKVVQIARPYLDNGRTLLVVNTHADYDHAWGNALFAGPDARFPAPILGAKQCAAAFAESEVVELLTKMQSEEPEIFGGLCLTPPTVLFDERLTIDGGDLTLHLFATPGHTPDHVSIYIPEIETLLAGDAAELPYPAARTVEGLPAMRRSLATLASHQAKRVLYCHAPVEAGPQLLADNIAYFDALEAACRMAWAHGAPWPPLAGVDLIALTDCHYEAITPHTELWRDVHDYYRTDGHAAQLRMMFDWLVSAG